MGFGKVINLRLGFLLILSIILLILAPVLVTLLWPDSSADQPGLSVTLRVELLIVFYSLHFSQLLDSICGQGSEGLGKNFMLVGMIALFSLFLFAGLFSFVDLYYPLYLRPPGFNPPYLNALSVLTDFLFMLAAILFVAILGFILISKRKSIIEWMKNV